MNATRLVFVLLALTGCPVRSGGPSSELPEPAWSESSSILGTWGDPRIEGRALPGLFTFRSPGAFSLLVREVAIADGPSGATYRPYEVTVSGNFRVRGDHLILTPLDIHGPEKYHEAATHLFGLSTPSVPAEFTFTVSAMELHLVLLPGHTNFVLVRRSGKAV